MMSSPSKKSCSNCLHFSFGHDCTGAVKHEGCSDWKPKENRQIQKKDAVRQDTLPDEGEESQLLAKVEEIKQLKSDLEVARKQYESDGKLLVERHDEIQKLRKELAEAKKEGGK